MIQFRSSHFDTNYCHDAAHYNFRMARGWESKSVEAQQAEANDRSTPHQRLTPAQAAGSRESAGLHLSRQRILQQIEASKDARQRKMLEDALAGIDQKIHTLGD